MKRILTAVVALPILIVSILISSLWWVFDLLAAAAMVVGLWEFYLLAKRLQLKPDPTAGFVSGALQTVSALTRRVSIPTLAGSQSSSKPFTCNSLQMASLLHFFSGVRHLRRRKCRPQTMPESVRRIR